MSRHLHTPGLHQSSLLNVTEWVSQSVNEWQALPIIGLGSDKKMQKCYLKKCVVCRAKYAPNVKQNMQQKQKERKVHPEPICSLSSVCGSGTLLWQVWHWRWWWSCCTTTAGGLEKIFLQLESFAPPAKGERGLHHVWFWNFRSNIWKSRLQSETAASTQKSAGFLMTIMLTFFLKFVT